MAVREGGRTARTTYLVRTEYHEPVVSLLECTLETGRTHQIRVHLQAIGHPVVGDASYGGARPGLDLARPFLHATAVAFAHPITGERDRRRGAAPSRARPRCSRGSLSRRAATSERTDESRTSERPSELLAERSAIAAASCSPGANGREPGIPARSERRIV